MAQVHKTSLPLNQSKSRGRSTGWFFLFLAAGALFYLYSIREKNQIYSEMTVKLHELEKQKKEALTSQSDLRLQIESQSDPAWVEMVLKRNLGMVREGQVKVYFHTD